LLLLLLLLLLVFTVIIISTELLAPSDRCLGWGRGWGWVWRAGLVAGLRVGQAFGVHLLPGFGVDSSSPQVPGHPTSLCDAGVKQQQQQTTNENTCNKDCVCMQAWIFL